MESQIAAANYTRCHKIICWIHNDYFSKLHWIKSSFLHTQSFSDSEWSLKKWNNYADANCRAKIFFLSDFLFKITENHGLKSQFAERRNVRYVVLRFFSRSRRSSFTSSGSVKSPQSFLHSGRDPLAQPLLSPLLE